MAAKKGSEAKLQKYGVFFVIPFIVIYLFFQLWPTIYTVLLSFTDMKGFKTGWHGSHVITKNLSELSTAGDELEKGFLSFKYETPVEVAEATEAVVKEEKVLPNAEMVDVSAKLKGKLLYDLRFDFAKIRYEEMEKMLKSNTQFALAERVIKDSDIAEPPALVKYQQGKATLAELVSEKGSLLNVVNESGITITNKAIVKAVAENKYDDAKVQKYLKKAKVKYAHLYAYVSGEKTLDEVIKSSKMNLLDLCKEAGIPVSAFTKVRGLKAKDVTEVTGLELQVKKPVMFILTKDIPYTENGIKHTLVLDQYVTLELTGEQVELNIVDEKLYEKAADGSKVAITTYSNNNDYMNKNENGTFFVSRKMNCVENNVKHDVVLEQTMNIHNGKVEIAENYYEFDKDGNKYFIGLVANGNILMNKEYQCNNRSYSLDQRAKVKANADTVSFIVDKENLYEFTNSGKFLLGAVSYNKSADAKKVKLRVCSNSEKDRPNADKLDVAISKCNTVHPVGFTNFSRLVDDKYFWGSVVNTFIMWTFNFAPQLGIALLFAIWFTDPRMQLKGKNLFRALFYMPNLLTAASVAILFKSLFGYPNGPIDQFLFNIGVRTESMLDGELLREAVNFFRNVTWSRGIVAFIQWWLWCGQTLIMLMAGITSISPSLYESAVVDGANQGQQTIYITLPLLRPMMLYILITSLIGGMQLFEIPFLLTDMRGGPDFKIRSMVVYMYNNAFQGGNDYAYGSTIAMGVFVITMIFSMLIYFFMQDRSDMGRR